MEVAGVNDRAQLAVAEAELRDRINERWMRRGVTMWDPERTYIDVEVELEPDVVLLPGVILQGACVIGAHAEVGPQVHLVDTVVGEGAVVASCCLPAFGDRRQCPGRPLRRPRRGHRGSLRRSGGAVVGSAADRPGLDARRPRPAGGGSVVGMEFTPRRRLELVSGRSHPELARDVARQLGVELGEANLREFANGEIHCRFDSSIRGSDVFIIQTHCGPVNDSLMEHLIMIDAAKRASAKRITAVCPYYGYSRQDRKATGREPITAKLVADMLSVAGADRVVSVDLHSGQIQGFFNVPFDHLTAAPVLVDYLRAQRSEGLVVVAPDAGRVKVAERFSQHLTADLAVVHKRRLRGPTNQVEALHVVGDVEGRQCVLIDDMIDTAGDHRGRRRSAGRPGCLRGVVHGHPRGAVGSGGRSAEELGADQGGGHRHPADPPGPAVRQVGGAVGGQADLRRHRRGVRGHLGVGDLRRGEPGLSGPGPTAGPGEWRPDLSSKSPAIGGRQNSQFSALSWSNAEEWVSGSNTDLSCKRGN